MKKHIIFDFDGVIVNSETLRMESMLETLQMFDIPFEKGEYQAFVGRSKDKDEEDILNRVGGDKNLFKKLVDKYYQIENSKFDKHLGLTDGLKDLLANLNNKEIRMYICSSSPRGYIEDLLRKHGIEGYFNHIISYDDVVNHKPHPETYLKMADYIGGNKKDILVLEDSFYGVNAAKDAGLDVVHMDSFHIKQGGEKIALASIQDIRDLEKYLNI